MSAAILACSPDGDGASVGETEHAGSTDDGGTGSASDLSFHRDIRPLLERHCVACHVDGSIAPFPLQSFEDVSGLREAIAVAVDEGTMPPWGTDPECNAFVGDPSLSTEERALIVRWVNVGAPEGDPSDFTPLEPLALPSLSRTDLVLEISEPYTPTESPDEYRCFLLPWPESEPVFVTGLQFEPDNVSMAHHAIAYVVAPGDLAQYEALDAADAGPGYACFGGPTGGGALDFIASRWLGAWAPGARVGDLPAGTGLRIEPGSTVILQMHYNTLAGNGAADQSRMRYQVATQVDREAFMLPWADPTWVAGGMPIAAGSPDTVHTFSIDPTMVINALNAAIPNDQPLEIFTAMHHMHRRGSRGSHSIERADGSRECILDLPRFDFDWQHDYRLTDPLVLQPGDQLRVECQWDNSDNPQDVNWGDGTDDEMCLGIYYLALAN